MLEQRSAQTLHRGADDLAIGEQRIDDLADVFDGDVIDHAHVAGARIDRHMRRGGSARVGMAVVVEGALDRDGRQRLQVHIL